MQQEIITSIAGELKIGTGQVDRTLALLAEGNTVPFIARYRKEATHGLDEEQILYIEKQYRYEQNLAERKEAVLALIEQRGKLTEEICQAVEGCRRLSEVEDLYRPYKEKKRTRAGMAIRRGLQPLADWMLAQPKAGGLAEEAAKYLGEEVPDAAAAIAGARDIVAEMVSDQAQLRWFVRREIEQRGRIVTKEKKNHADERRVYEMYYDRTEPVPKLPDHRIMAIDRAEKEKVITMSFAYDKEGCLAHALREMQIREDGSCAEVLHEAVADGLERLLYPSVENQVRASLSERAQKASIELFSMNLEKLLLQPPLIGHVVMGFDPAFRTGCKLAVLDPTGKLLHIDKIFPHAPVGDAVGARQKMTSLIRQYNVGIIAIGNGTASRESERFVAELIREANLDVRYAIVSEAGASVYSAGEIARREFPDLHVEERSAVSIGRRLLDPLSELIKIDPQSIGVGQYQHDLPAKALRERLDEVVMKCVNRIGADLNTASPELLRHISGLNKTTAAEIVRWRNENGRFANRRQLLAVSKLGAKTYTQCAGFLRIVGGEEPLDETALHPESYEAARKVMAACGIKQLGAEEAQFPKEKTANLGIDEYTLHDIEEAIRRPLRDYRERFEGALLRSDILELSDLKEGDVLSGTVRNVVDFGAFVDIGLHEDGLVHISRMSRRRIGHPSEILSVGQIITVYVVGIDQERGRVQLSLLPPEELARREHARGGRSGKKNGAENRSGQHRKNDGPGTRGKSTRQHNEAGKRDGRHADKDEPLSAEDSLARLMDKYGSRHRNRKPHSK